jgi:hypothetical protein
LCNFLTNTEITEAFETEIRELAFSLTPGGILLVLGATGGAYSQVYAKLDALVSTRGRPRLKKVLDSEIRAHANSTTRNRVAAHIIKNLAHLGEISPGDLDEIRVHLPPDVRTLNAAEVKFPRFTILGFKREGPLALSRAKQRRRGRRAAGL